MCCRCSTCAACRPGTFARLWSSCSARTRPACRPRRSAGCAKDWEAEHARFRARSLRFHRYAYLFVDGVHVSVRLGEDDRLCLLVVIGVREDGVNSNMAYWRGSRSRSGSPRRSVGRSPRDPPLRVCVPAGSEVCLQSCPVRAAAGAAAFDDAAVAQIAQEPSDVDVAGVRE